MDDQQLAAQRPSDIDEALDRMSASLDVFHGRPDNRAIFLRVYHEMTWEVHDAVHGFGDYQGRSVFMDPAWVRRLSGRFASLYFRSLAGPGSDPGRPGSQAWKVAHDVAREQDSTVLLNALLGINAHINYDLADAIAQNLDPMELRDPSALQLRKFDHDQVNNLLVRSMGRIQDVLARDYAPVLGLGDRLLGRVDERLSEVGLTHYRAQVWGDAISYATARADDQTGRREELVRAKLDWESHRVAKQLRARRGLWQIERAANLPWVVFEDRRWDLIEVRERRRPTRLPDPLHC